MLQNKRFYCPSARHGDVMGSCDITQLPDIPNTRRRSVNLSSSSWFVSRGRAKKKRTHCTAVGWAQIRIAFCQGNRNSA
jgi:hypothetical protein